MIKSPAPPPMIYRNIVVVAAFSDDGRMLHWVPTTPLMANDPAKRATTTERLISGLRRRAADEGLPLDLSAVAMFRTKRDWFHSDHFPEWTPESPDWLPWEVSAQ
jgi:hypothetical protein